jgi:acetyl esterase/lipase
MSTRHLVDPELSAILDQLPQVQLTAESLPMIRASSAAMLASIQVPETPNLVVSERYVPGPEGAPDVRVLLYQPTQLTQPTAGFLWIHGGGYVGGSADSDDINSRTIADQLGCVVVSVNYRLAPETPHPGPVALCERRRARGRHRAHRHRWRQRRRRTCGGISAAGPRPRRGATGISAAARAHARRPNGYS